MSCTWAFEDKLPSLLGVSVIIVCKSIRYPSRQKLIRYVADLSSLDACGMESRISVSFALFPHAYLLKDTSSRRIREWAPTAPQFSCQRRARRKCHQCLLKLDPLIHAHGRHLDSLFGVTCFVYVTIIICHPSCPRRYPQTELLIHLQLPLSLLAPSAS